MIRPLTCVCFLMACGSGLYLYQSKHEVQVLDRQIEKTVRDIETTREQTRLLHAEWMLLNDPERLRQFADRYLTLKTVAPGQFTSLADLASRLPAPRANEPEKPVPAVDGEPVIAAPAADPLPPTQAEPAPAMVAEEVLPIPPLPVPPRAPVQVASQSAAPAPSAPPSHAAERRPPRPPAVAESRPVESRPTESRPIQEAVSRPAPRPAAESRVAESRAPEPRVESRPVVAAAAPRPLPVAAPAPAPVHLAPQPQPAAPRPAYGGSMLGMAHGTLPAPLPRPTPVNATQWVNGN